MSETALVPVQQSNVTDSDILHLVFLLEESAAFLKSRYGTTDISVKCEITAECGQAIVTGQENDISPEQWYAAAQSILAEAREVEASNAVIYKLGELNQWKEDVA